VWGREKIDTVRRDVSLRINSQNNLVDAACINKRQLLCDLLKRPAKNVTFRRKPAMRRNSFLEPVSLFVIGLNCERRSRATQTTVDYFFAMKSTSIIDRRYICGPDKLRYESVIAPDEAEKWVSGWRSQANRGAANGSKISISVS
jgi:hypothetical protein